MTTREAAEGWVPPADGRRVWHYQLAGRTLCGRYGLFPESILVPETGASSSEQGDCAACARALRATGKRRA